MRIVVPKSFMYWNWRAVLPALMGSTRDAGALQPVVQAEAAGEHAVAEGDLGDVAVVGAGGDGEPADEVGPRLEVRLRVAADHGLARGPGRRVELDDFAHGHGEQAEGVVVAEVRLLRERQTGDVVQALEVAGLEAGLGELLPVERHALVDAREHPAETLQLERSQLLPVDGLVLPVPDGHGLSLCRCRSAGNHTGAGGGLACRRPALLPRPRAGGRRIPPGGIIV